MDYGVQYCGGWTLVAFTSNISLIDGQSYNNIISEVNYLLLRHLLKKSKIEILSSNK